MSQIVGAQVTCGCGAELAVELVESLDPQRRPDLRARILDGTFHCFPCTACGRVTRVDRRFAYLDFERRHWFIVFPEAELPWRKERVALVEASFRTTMVEHAPPIVRSWAPEMLRRVIFGVAALRATLAALDAGLDDRRVQLLALELRDELRLGHDGHAYLHLASARPPESITFAWAPAGTMETLPLTVPYERFAATLALEEAEAQRRAPRLWSAGICVDHRVELIEEAAPRPPDDLPAGTPMPANITPADDGRGEGYPP